VADAATGTVLGRGAAGPSNIRSVGVVAAAAELDAAVGRAFRAANLPRARVGAACLGLAGVGRPDGRDAVQSWAELDGLADAVSVVPDAALLFAAGTPDGWGLAVIAGTGSIALAKSPAGEVCRAGGWGHLLGDGGSGFQIVVSALRACCHAVDGCGPATCLVDRFVAEMNVTTPADLVSAVYSGAWDRAALAALAPVVLETAAADEVAARVVAEQADELARTAAAAVASAGLPTGRLPLALTGGVLLNSETFRAGFLAALRKRGIDTDPVRTVDDPAVGAITLARGLLRTGAAR
jgi:N-acetylglucosamine kinase-like BadF-type ATPase